MPNGSQMNCPFGGDKNSGLDGLKEYLRIKEHHVEHAYRDFQLLRLTGRDMSGLSYNQGALRHSRRAPFLPMLWGGPPLFGRNFLDAE